MSPDVELVLIRLVDKVTDILRKLEIIIDQEIEANK